MDFARICFDDCYFSRVTNGMHFAGALDIAATQPDDRCILIRYAPVINDPGYWNMDASQAGGVRLVLSNFAGPYHSHSRQTIANAASIEFIESRQFFLGSRDDQFAAALERNPALRAEAVEQSHTGNAQLCL